jgi:hypothetical protein
MMTMSPLAIAHRYDPSISSSALAGSRPSHRRCRCWPEQSLRLVHRNPVRMSGFHPAEPIPTGIMNGRCGGITGQFCRRLKRAEWVTMPPLGELVLPNLTLAQP